MLIYAIIYYVVQVQTMKKSQKNTSLNNLTNDLLLLVPGSRIYAEEQNPAANGCWLVKCFALRDHCYHNLQPCINTRQITLGIIMAVQNRSIVNWTVIDCNICCTW